MEIKPMPNGSSNTTGNSNETRPSMVSGSPRLGLNQSPLPPPEHLQHLIALSEQYDLQARENMLRSLEPHLLLALLLQHHPVLLQRLQQLLRHPLLQ